MKIRYLINVLTGTKRAMLNAGAREEKCPHCGYLTPVYYHSGYKAASNCLWCGKEISEYFCQLCGKPYQKDEIPCADYSRGIYGGAHKSCLENMLSASRMEGKMAKWRPEEWEPLWTEEQIKSAPESIRLQMQMCYEDGADAMLEALRKRGKHITGHGVKTVGDPLWLSL